MPDDLVADARKQAERSSPAVRAAARLRIARVQSTIDPAQARITFEMALDEIRSVPSRDRGSFFGQAQEIAAAFAPDLLREIPSNSTFPKNFQSGRLVDIMLKSGHIDAAFDYVIQYDDPFSFPFGYAGNLMHKLDDERQLAVLLRAIDAWRTSRDSELMPEQGIPKISGHRDLIRVLHLQMDFIRLFQWQWKILPSEEALAVVRTHCDGAARLGDLGWLRGRDPNHLQP
jgi:hypothetical protein